MRSRITVIAAFALVLGTSMGVFGQATVNVSPGDDLQAAVNEAGAGGTVIFAPGWYQMPPSTPGDNVGIVLSHEHDGITLQGAGPGTDPTQATILDAEGYFLETGMEFNTSDFVVDGFTFINFYDEAVYFDGEMFNTEMRNCWILACDSGIDADGDGGFYDSSNPNNFDEMVRFRNCIFARGGDDGTDINTNCMFAFINCDFYDWDSDLQENEDSTYIVLLNCILHAGRHSDDLSSGDAGGEIECRNCLFFDPPEGDADGPGGIQFEGIVTDTDSVAGDPMYVNVGAHVPLMQLDFHLKPGSPALTAGKDENGNATFIGALGPAQ